MKLINPCYEILKIDEGMESLKFIEEVARTCYKSKTQTKSDEITKSFIKNQLMAHGHEAMLEHSMMSVKFIVSRSISHEIVRHRLFSFAQESTRYCKYTGEINFIKPFWYDKAPFNDKMIFEEALIAAEATYQALLDNGHTAQEAREVLPNALKTEIIVSGNYREWRNFFKLRAANITGPAHPDMNVIACPLLYEASSRVPVIFDDIYVDMTQDKSAMKNWRGKIFNHDKLHTYEKWPG